MEIPTASATLVERVVRHERAFLVFTIAAVTLACWSWIVPMSRDRYGAMTGPSAWMMTGRWDTGHVLMLGAMWIVMMAGMMLPSTAPLLLLYAGAARRSGAIRLGVEHGLFCLGCCWALMLLLFAGGVMNLSVIGALTAFVLFEKLTPLGPQSVHVTGGLLMAAGLWVATI